MEPNTLREDRIRQVAVVFQEIRIGRTASGNSISPMPERQFHPDQHALWPSCSNDRDPARGHQLGGTLTF